ncbi:methyl-accepting chemotaxis protein [Vibrio crassostreae]|uniref:methyl-accepting chemotaxis protein n=1 Tax=Vibrio crassostreae TaxID=246167 RepID=UPI000F48F043|nr:methyl-accepting chemotaxis protein [Vibrio crassostreae]ROR13945.1 methyl-accepting chemotaxis sensory transducer with Cache sensor [Vibrio crassostreae]ROR26957.1 methyl-accepting chemotaxis sensory transducer with Cache sensor [Vibrio crassostreae]TCN77024.1 methyl-accepting chemotaxis sensory transducer with Cache sensor [Vibrio crassostreae]TCV22380.1 methyl-accepting chemotaxis sensory transducer with Cache sensor [Vibrio crassostreae]TWD67689.1 methyl-accepting chemotaxis sensory tra
MKLSNLSIKLKLVSIVILSVVLLVMASTFNLMQQRASSMEERQDKLSAQVETAVSLANYYYSQRSVLGEEVAKDRALQAIKTLRYDNTNYFWILNQQLNIISHPLKPELDGTNAGNLRDGAGKHHWREMVTISRTPEEKGFLDYQWMSPQGELKDKISYVQLFPEWNWVIGSGILVADIQEAFYALAIKEGMVAVVLSGLLFAMGYAISNNILVPLNKLIDNTHKIADGDLRVRMNMTRKDELGDMSHQIDTMLDKLQSTLRTANESADLSSNMASHIAQASEEAATSVNAQHAQLELLSTAMTEMSATISDVAVNAENTAASTNKVVDHANQNDEHMQVTSTTISQVSDNISTANNLVRDLQSGVTEISQVVGVIRDVSEQTNLLALNAAIEAARAGEQGRGFAVVADEVRNLASRTQNSTNEVQSTIEKLTQQAERTFKAMQSSNEKVDHSVVASNETRQQLDVIVNELHNANDMVAQIAAASEQQSTVATEMSESVTGIHLAANEVLQASQSLAEDSQKMANTTEHLTEQLKYFKV